MNLMSLGNTAAFFALILLAGFIAGRCGMLRTEAKGGLTNIVLYVALPCTIVGSFSANLSRGLLHDMLITFIVAVVTQAAGQIGSVIFFKKQPADRRNVLRYGLIVCNSGFFGMSVLSALFGGGAALSLGAIYLIPQRFAMWIFGVPVFTADKDRFALMKTLVHPCMIAVYVGLGMMLLGLEMPEILGRPVNAIGACTMPLSMLVIGSILSETKAKMLVDRQIIFYCLLRLVALPCVAFAACLIFGATLDITRVCVLMAGMPAPTTAGLLALRYGGDEKLGSASIVVSTIFFFALLPVWLTIFDMVF
jgi:predicted permease